MRTAKEEARELLDTLPDDVTLDGIAMELQLRASILRGLQQVARGEGVSHEEVKRRLSSWLESSGRPNLSKT
ncbi:MAG: hypothetical protein HY873_10740 [Chloroflexi bacterium]|nr:hypothetical protein [Chloroflexota bacterium]